MLVLGVDRVVVVVVVVVPLCYFLFTNVGSGGVSNDLFTKCVFGRFI